MHPAFRFKLQKILEYRQQLEDQAQMALAQARSRFTKQGEYIDQLRDSLEQGLIQFESRKNITQADFWLWFNYEKRIKSDIAQAKQELQKLAQEVEQLRSEAVLRSKERKLLEKLKSNQAEDFVKNMQKREQKEFDEMATLRYASPNI